MTTMTSGHETPKGTIRALDVGRHRQERQMGPVVSDCCGECQAAVAWGAQRLDL